MMAKSKIIQAGPITKEQYEDMLFDPNNVIEEKVIWKKKERTVYVYVNGKLGAIQKNGRSGTTFNAIL